MRRNKKELEEIRIKKKEEKVTLQDTTTQHVSDFQSARRSPVGDLCELPSTSHFHVIVDRVSQQVL